MGVVTKIQVFAFGLLGFALTYPIHPNDYAENTLEINVTSVDFDPSQCVLARTNPWKSVAISPSPFPDPPPFGGLNILAGNVSLGSTVANRASQPEDQVSWEQPSGQERTDGSHRGVRHFGDKNCTQVASHKFQNVLGFLRTTKPASIAEDDDFWFVWTCDQSPKVTVWRSQDGPFEDRWMKVYSRGSLSEMTGAVKLEGGYHNSRYMMADLGMSEGIGGKGGSGEVALFRVGTRPPG